MTLTDDCHWRRPRAVCASETDIEKKTENYNFLNDSLAFIDEGICLSNAQRVK